jgi:cobalt/nickel transport protein
VAFVDLGHALQPLDGGGFQATYTPAAPGDHILAVHADPQMIDGEFVLDFAKLVLHVGDSQEGWDRVLGHRLEVVPLTRPYGIPVGATFRAQVVGNRVPAAGVLVRIERRNDSPPNPLPAEHWRARVEKTSASGEFVTNFDKAGDWTLVARQEGRSVARNGQNVREILRATLWVHVGE